MYCTTHEPGLQCLQRLRTDKCGTLTIGNALIYGYSLVLRPPWGRGELNLILRNAISAVALLAALGGCASRVTVNDPTIPDPLIAKIPMSVAIRFPDSFDHYVHEEKLIGKETWTIDLGRSNILLFTKLFGSMFDELIVIEDDTDPKDLPIDAYIEPSIDAFEFSTPSQSQTEAFAVWIRYRIKIFDSEGDQFANWPISAYGKSQTTLMGGDDALRRAAVLAMRDAAALMVMQLDKATRISRLNRSKVSSAAVRSEPEKPEKPEKPEQTMPEPDEEGPPTSASQEILDETG